MIQQIVAQAPIFLLIAVRCLAMIRSVPLLSTQAVPSVARVALAGYVAFLVMPSISFQEWNVPVYSLEYLLLVIGEGMIGIITGFYISIIFSAFSSAGQFFTYQMGFGASEVYDALSQVENPLMGQYLNLIAMLLFLQVDGFQRLFLVGITESFQSINCFSLIQAQDDLLTFLLSGLTDLFFNGLMISLPIIGTLFLISVSMGILSKAAPQMNLLSEGLPITILVAFFLLTALLPTMSDYFIRSFETGFYKLELFFSSIGGIS
jgi:flagellar biosynthetic protein FliR